MKLARQLVRLTLVFAAVAAVWWPHFSHFAIDKTDVDAEAMTPLRDRPTDGMLVEIAAMTQGVGHDGPAGEAVARADRIVSGFVDMPTLLDGPFQLRGHPSDYRQGPPTFQLFMSGLGVEDWLLTAYDATADPRFRQLALARVLAFAAHERRQYQDIGFLWNDHAVAARMGVLIKLWRHLRAAKDIDEGARVAVLSLALRNARLLAAREHFTVRTNHGVAQNLALLQAAAAFPTLPEAPQWRRTAFERLAAQLGFYVSAEGMVLEHSAAYHHLGADLLARIVRLAALNGVDPPASVAEAARRTGEVLQVLVRTDGSLPLLGNTSGGLKVQLPIVPSDGSGPVSYHAPHPVADHRPLLMPLSGYALWWAGEQAGRQSQTLVTWAHHVGHGHKHADEGAVMYWSGGVDWVTGTGYWPYGARFMDLAYSWPGSNAPHAAGEAATSDRKAELLAHDLGKQTAFVDVVRTVPGGGQLRRQVLQLGTDQLLVLDFSDGIGSGTEVIWTVDPQLSLTPSSGHGGFVSSAAPDGRRLVVSTAGHPQSSVTLRRGSTSPFAGWTVENFRPVPADALHVRQPAADAVAAIFFRVTDPVEGGPPTLRLPVGAGPERWSTQIAFADGRQLNIDREGAVILVTQQSAGANPVVVHRMSLQAPPPVEAGRSALRQSYVDATKRFPQWRNLALYRERVTWAMVALAIGLEFGAWIALRAARGRLDRARRPGHWAAVAMWILLPLWLVKVYLQV